MPRNRIKMIKPQFVGAGRAGKTGTTRCMLGHNDQAASYVGRVWMTRLFRSETALTVVGTQRQRLVVVRRGTGDDGGGRCCCFFFRWRRQPGVCVCVCGSYLHVDDVVVGHVGRNYESALAGWAAGVIAAIKQGRLQEGAVQGVRANTTKTTTTAAAVVAVAAAAVAVVMVMVMMMVMMMGARVLFVAYRCLPERSPKQA